MGLIRTNVAALSVAALALATAPAARADIMIHPTTLSFAGVATDTVSFPEFDPNLGTLDSINVSIMGTLTFQTLVAPSTTFAPQLSFDIGQVGPQGFVAAGGQLTLLPQTNPLPTASQPLTYTAGFSFAVTFDAATDLVGFDVPNVSATGATLISPISAVAQRADFIEGLVPLGVMQSLQLAPTNFSPIAGINGGGSAVVTYNFTPAPAPVGEPATLSLLGIGVAAVGAALRRRQP